MEPDGELDDKLKHMAKIVLKCNGEVVKEIPLARSQFTIGRALDNDIVINSSEVSGHHARILQEAEAWVIEDLNSTNGTFFNGWKMIQHRLKHDDRVMIGKYLLLYQEESAEGRHGVSDAEPERTMILDSKKQRDLMKTVQAGVAVKPVEKLGCLTLLKGRADRKWYELSGTQTSIGSEPTAAVRLRGWFAPKCAAVIVREGAAFIIKNGDGKRVIVNGQPVLSRKELRSGDRVSVAGVLLEFSLQDRAR